MMSDVRVPYFDNHLPKHDERELKNKMTLDELGLCTASQ